MDFTNRGTQPQVVAPSSHSTAPAASGGSKKHKDSGNKWLKVGTLLLGGAITVLLVALVVVASTGGAKAEKAYVDTSKLQAIFLNTGQVYFGNVKSLNDRYFVLTNIYYLQTANSSSSSSSSSSTSGNVTLVKLGCELHKPNDQMIINSDQVTFWENLQDNGQVSNAVKTFEKDNPNGQNCADQSSSSSSNSSNSVQSAGTNNSSSNTSNSSNTTKTTR